MPIARLLQFEAFSPEDISLITGAFESVVSVLRLTDRDDPETIERVARKIIECAQTGERDPIRLRNGKAATLISFVLINCDLNI
jgi:hypothetical protein